MQSKELIVQGLAAVLISLKKKYPQLEDEVKDVVRSCQTCLKTGSYADASSTLKKFAESANKSVVSDKKNQEKVLFSLLDKFNSFPLGTLSSEQLSKVLSIQRSIKIGDTDFSSAFDTINSLLDDVSSSVGVLKEKNFGISKVSGGYQEGVSDILHADLAVATRRIGRDLGRLIEQLISQYPDDEDIIKLKSEVNGIGEGSAKFFKAIDLLSRTSWALSKISEKQINSDKVYIGRLATQFKGLASLCKEQTGLNSKSQERLGHFEGEFKACLVQLESVGRNTSDIGHLKKAMLDKLVSLQSCMSEFVIDQGALLNTQSELIAKQANELASNVKESDLLLAKLKVASKKANEDRLTGLANRAGYEDHLDASRNIWITKKEKVGLVLLDIDHFKSVNDTYGHTIGDEVLVHLAGVLKEVKEKFKSIHLSRYGGEEFAVIINKMSPNDVLNIARYINKKIARTPYVNKASGLDINITVSVGVAMFLDEDDTTKRIFEGADRALYQAKSTGRNRVWVYNVKRQSNSNSQS